MYHHHHHHPSATNIIQPSHPPPNVGKFLVFFWNWFISTSGASFLKRNQTDSMTTYRQRIVRIVHWHNTNYTTQSLIYYVEQSQSYRIELSRSIMDCRQSSQDRNLSLTMGEWLVRNVFLGIKIGMNEPFPEFYPVCLSVEIFSVLISNYLFLWDQNHKYCYKKQILTTSIHK